MEDVEQWVKYRLLFMYGVPLNTIDLTSSMHSLGAGGKRQQNDGHRCGVYAALNAVRVLQRLLATQPQHSDDKAIQEAAVRGMADVTQAAVDTARSRFG